MTQTIKKFILQISVASVVMLAIAAVSILTGTFGIKSKDLPPAYAETKIAREGRKIFQQAGCASCHQILRQGGLGPDLTFVGKKYSKDEIKSIVRDPKENLGDTKSTRLMPSFTKKILPDSKLEKLSNYLETLK